LAKITVNRNAMQKPVVAANRLNDEIKVAEIRLVGDEESFKKISEKAGEVVEAGVYEIRRAIRIAEKCELDLVEINAAAVPPVCRIVDYNKFLYEKKKREKEIKSNAVKTIIKEVRFSPDTHDHDFDFKLRHAEGFLKEGAKVKAYVMFKGREIAFKERGELLLLRFIQALEDFGTPEAMPKLEGKRMFVFIGPKKKK
jgi:translation initiation factor IF-3